MSLSHAHRYMVDYVARKGSVSTYGKSVTAIQYLDELVDLGLASVEDVDHHRVFTLTEAGKAS